MTRVSVELVPRDEAAIKEELELLKENFSGIDVINIPELLRYDIRSWEGAKIAQNYYEKCNAAYSRHRY